MRARSSEKVKQVLDLMKLLSIKVEARERMSEGGFIEKIVFYIDEEKYSEAAPAAPTGEAQEAPAKVEEIASGPSSQEHV